jgi:hypothetical protein
MVRVVQVGGGVDTLGRDIIPTGVCRPFILLTGARSVVLMVKRLRSTGLAGTGALFLVLVIAGIAAGRTVLAEVAPTATIASFEDTNGNGIDDDCEENVVPLPDGGAAAELLVDLDGDGTISTSEAAQSGRIGGKNCNHGGYVSWVAQGSCVPVVPVTAPVTEGVTGPLVGVVADVTPTTAETCAAEAPTTEVAPTTVCVAIPPPVRDPALDLQKNGHGKWVSTVAQSDAIGGKNCNHGGAVSDAAKKDHAAAAAAREAAKAEREAARAERKAAREAAKSAKGHGKP